MTIFHNSWDGLYRSPFGAAEVSSEVKLAVDVTDAYPESVELVVYDDDKSNAYEMKPEGAGRYTAALKMPETGGQLWYYFRINFRQGEEIHSVYYGNNYEGTGGTGAEYESEPQGYQITVYKKASVPEWYKSAIVYQIFPDRFARDDDWKERCEAAAAARRAQISEWRERDGQGVQPQEKFIEEDWYKPAYYVRNEENDVTGWPFYGGSLKGIESKLDYLTSLGVGAIYLNPIFAAVSNHRYDTSDYMEIDPMLGTEEDFVHLCEAAKAKGIRIILDGVFNHTGHDSKYFDRFGMYGNGAYNNPDSPYRYWFKFDENEEIGYKSWWGVPDLPEVNEDNAGFQQLITGERGVLAKWLRLGASGWRLDVADEMPDWFIRDIRKRVKTTDPDSVLIGEVWEDASNKISYSERRKYFAGEELDSTMHYPLRDILLDYVNYTIGSGLAGNKLMSLAENYPEENFYGTLNLIGSHDRERILTMMAGEEDRYSACRKVKMLSTLQYVLPGVPCVYYGDETGMTGGKDPENRSGFIWGREDGDLQYHYRHLGKLYQEHPVLKYGRFEMLSGKYGIPEDVLAFIRTDESEKILVLANRSYGPVKVEIGGLPQLGGKYALDLMTSKEIEMSGGTFADAISMEPLSCMVISIMDEKPVKEKFDRGAGVICHISSLGEGKFGKPAREFVDYIKSAGFSVWQILPLNPTGLGGSPYNSTATFAGNPEFINADELPDASGFEEFCRKNAAWLDEYVAFTILLEKNNGAPWFRWPEEERNGLTPELVGKLPRDRMLELMVEQYYFHVQWEELKKYANDRGVKLMGDLPIFTSLNSADIWNNRYLFRTDEEGRLSSHAGCPPDEFNADGQDWGMPLYDWDSMKADGYRWWIRRLAQCAERYDILRLDHFRGFSEYFSIPNGGRAADGTWQHGPGMDFFRCTGKALREMGHGDFKIIAEDLGNLDAEVYNLIKMTGFPGMNVWQFSAAEMKEMTEDEQRGRIFYTGTHDNDTILSFSDNDEEKAREAIRFIYESKAPLAIIQLQDMFLLGKEARMNVPGIADGNWKWKIPGKTIEDAFPDADKTAAEYRKLSEDTGRI